MVENTVKQEMSRTAETSDNKESLLSKYTAEYTKIIMDKLDAVVNNIGKRKIESADFITIKELFDENITLNEYEYIPFTSTIDGKKYATQKHFIGVNKLRYLEQLFVKNPVENIIKEHWSDTAKANARKSYNSALLNIKKELNKIEEDFKNLELIYAHEHSLTKDFLTKLKEFNNTIEDNVDLVIDNALQHNKYLENIYKKDFYSGTPNKDRQLSNVAFSQTILGNDVLRRKLEDSDSKVITDASGAITKTTRALMAIKNAMIGNYRNVSSNNIKSLDNVSNISSFLNDIYISLITPDYTVSGIANYDVDNIYKGFTSTEIQDMVDTLATTIDSYIISTAVKPSIYYEKVAKALRNQAIANKDTQTLEAIDNGTHELLKKLRNYSTIEEWATYLVDGKIDHLFSFLKDSAFTILNSDINKKILISNGMTEEAASELITKYNTLRERVRTNKPLLDQIFKQASLVSKAMSNSSWSDIEDSYISYENDEETLVENGDAGNLELSRQKPPHETMHNKVQFILSNILQIDSKNRPVRNSFGDFKRMRMTNVYYQILEILNNSNRYISDSNVMIDVLIQNTYQKPFINQILDYVIEGRERNPETGNYNVKDPELLAALYTDFNKAFTRMVVMSNSGYLFNANTSPKAQSLKHSWYRDIADNISIDPDVSIMDNNGRLSIKKAQKARTYLTNYVEDKGPKMDLLDNVNTMFYNTKTIDVVLRTIGIKLKPDQLQNVKNMSYKSPLFLSVKKLINKASKYEQDDASKNNQNTVEEQEALNIENNVDEVYAVKKFDNFYNRIADIIADVVNVNDSDYYAGSTTLKSKKKGWISKNSFDNPTYISMLNQQINELLDTGTVSDYIKTLFETPGMLNTDYTYDDASKMSLKDWSIEGSVSPLMDLLSQYDDLKKRGLIKRSKVGTFFSLEKIGDEDVNTISERSYLTYVMNSYFEGVHSLMPNSEVDIKYNGVKTAMYTLPPLADSGNIISVILPRIRLSESRVEEVELPDGAGWVDMVTGDIEMRSTTEVYITPEDTNYRTKLHSYIFKSVVAELRRIEAIREGKKGFLKIQNIEKSGKRFVLFPELNQYLEDTVSVDKNGKTKVTEKGLYTLYKEAINENKSVAFYTELNKLLFGEQGIITKGVQNFIQLTKDLDVLHNTETSKGEPFSDIECEDFYLNDLVAKNYYVNMLMSDPAYFKADKITNDVSVDLVKRFKAVNSHTMKGDTAVLDAADKKCRTLYVSMKEVTSEISNYIDSIYKDASSKDRNKLKTLWSKAIDSSDGQGIITTHGLECQMKMQGYSTAEMKEAIAKMELENTPDIKTLFHTHVFKPVYMSIATDSNSGQRIPTYIKNSEFPAVIMGGVFKSNPKMKALLEYAEENNIHKIQFTSALKSGCYNAVPIENINSKKDIYNTIKKIKSSSKGDVIHELDWIGGGESVKTDKDKDKLDLGIQFLKLPLQGMKYNSDNRGIVNFKGKDLTGKEYINLYLNTLYKKLFSNYTAISENIETPDKLRDAMIRVMTSSKNSGIENINIADINEDGTFKTNLSIPTIMRTAYSSMCGIFKRASKITVDGKTNIQASEVLVDEDSLATRMVAGVDIVINGHTIPKNTEFTYNDVAKFIDRDSFHKELNDYWKRGVLEFKDIEVYASVPKHWYKVLLDENGKLDINRIPKEFRSFIGYRVPTEGDCSVCPMYIKDVIPSTHGHTVVVPKDFIAITGSDFDVDKVFSFFREMSVNYSSKARKAYNEYFKETKTKNLSEVKSIDDFIQDNIGNKDSKYDLKTSDIIISRHNPYTDKDNKNVEITEDDIENLSVPQVNNLLLDLTLARFSNPYSTRERLKQSNYESIKQVSDMVIKYTNLTEAEKEEVKRKLKKGENPYIEDYVNNTSIDTSKYAARNEQKALYDSSNLYNRLQQNNESINNVGPFAVTKSTITLLADEPLIVNKKYKFSIDGKEVDKLVIEKDTLGDLVTDNSGNSVAGTVDGAKDPRLNNINVNSKTINIATVLITLGVDYPTIALLLKHPVVKNLMDYSITDISTKSLEQFVLKEWLGAEDSDGAVVTKYNKYKALSSDAAYKKACRYKVLGIDTKDGSKDSFKVEISRGELLTDLMENDFEKIPIDNEIKVLSIINKVCNIADSLRYFTSATRYDKTSVCVNSNSIYEQAYRILYSLEAYSRMGDEKQAVYRRTPVSVPYALIENELRSYINNQAQEGGESTANKEVPTTETNLYNMFRNTIIGLWKGSEKAKGMDSISMYAEMFKLFGADIPNQHLGKYFKELTDGMIYMMRAFQQMRFNQGKILTTAQIEEICQLHTKYMMSKLNSFGATRIGDLTILSASDRMYEYVAQFPWDWVESKNKFKTKYPNLKDNLILNNISVNLAYKDKYTKYISLADITPFIKDPVYNTNMYNAWSELLNYTDKDGNPVDEVQQKARQLVTYALMLNGGYYTTKSIASYIPKDALSSIEGYNDIFDPKRYATYEDMQGDLNNFYIQAVLNSSTIKTYTLKDAINKEFIKVIPHPNNNKLYAIENMLKDDSDAVFEVAGIAGGKISYKEKEDYDIYSTIVKGRKVIFIPKFNTNENTVEYIGYPQISKGDYTVMDANLDYSNIEDLNELIKPLDDSITKISNNVNNYIVYDSVTEELKNAVEVDTTLNTDKPINEGDNSTTGGESVSGVEVITQNNELTKNNIPKQETSTNETDGMPVGTDYNPIPNIDPNIFSALGEAANNTLDISASIESNISKADTKARTDLYNQIPYEKLLDSKTNSISKDWLARVPGTDVNSLEYKNNQSLFNKLSKLFKGNNTRAMGLYFAVQDKQFRDLYNISSAENGGINYTTIFNELANTVKGKSEELTNNFMDFFTESLIKSGRIKDFYSVEEKTEAVKIAENINSSLLNSSKGSLNYKLGIAETTKDGKTGLAIRFIDFTDNVLDKGASAIKDDNVKAIDSTLFKQASLYDKLVTVLQNSNIDVKPFQKDMEDKALGITDFSPSEVEGKQLLATIKLSKRKGGKEALTEEFAHVVVRSMLNNKTVKDFVDNIDDSIIAKVLGRKALSKYTESGYNQEALKEEVAGKLLAEFLNELYKRDANAQVLSDTEYSTIATKAMLAISKKFASIDSEIIENMLMQLSEIADMTRKQIAEGKLDVTMLVENSKNRKLLLHQLNTISSDMSRLKSVLKDFRKTEYRKLQNPQSRNMTKEDLDAYVKDQDKFIQTINNKLSKNAILEGIVDYNNVTVERLKQLDKDMQTVSAMQYDSSKANECATLLREIHTITKAYAQDYNRMRDALYDLENDRDSLSDEDYEALVNSTEDIMSSLAILNDRYSKYIYNVFAKRIMPLVDEYNAELPVDRQITVDSILKYAERDISWLDRWLYSAGDSNNALIRIFDKIKSDAQNRAKLDTLDMIKNIQSAATEYIEQSGSHDFDFMYSKDDKGEKTGYYYSRYNIGKYAHDKRAYLNDLMSKVNKGEITRSTFFSLKEAWVNKHEDKDGNLISSDYLSEPLTEPQQKFYDKFMSLYKTCVDMLPPNTIKENGIICIPKSTFEEAKEVRNVNDINNLLKNTLANTTKGRLDQDIYQVSNTAIDYSGNLMECLPIYYTTLPKGETMNNMTSDAVSSIIAFAAMANNYRHMNHELAMLEIGRDITDNLKIAQNKGVIPIVEKFRYNKNVTEESRVYKSASNSNFRSKLDDFFSSQVYGNFKKSGYITLPFGLGTWQLNKIAGNLNALTSLYTYAGNISASIANVGTGLVQALPERFAGEYFTAKNLTQADFNFWKEMPSFMAEVGKIVKTNKLSLFLEQFNVLQDYQTKLMEIDYTKTSRLGQLMDMNALYVMSNSGELFLQSRTALALALNIKMKDTKSGEEVSLWDALKVEYIDPKNHSKGARLVVPKHIKNLDGSAFKRSSIIKFTERSKFINQRLHGIYNREDFASAQLYAAGQLVFMFKKYFIANMQRRYQKANYSYALGGETEGYYRTLSNFITQSVIDIKNQQFDIKARWDSMTRTQKANIWRALSEYGLFLSLLALCLMRNWDDDDDDEKVWGSEMFKHQAFRICTELQGMVPGTGYIKANLKLFDNPAAALSLSSRFLYFLDALKFWDWGSFAEEDDIIKSGRFKDKTKAYRGAAMSIPLYSTLYNGLHPWEVTQWYEKDLN